jgi:hypothetical protein
LAETTRGLRRVVSLAGKVSIAQGRSAVDALDQMGCAAIVLDYRGQSMIVNSLAETMMSHDLRLTNNRLHALDRGSDQRLQRFIACSVPPRAPGSPVPQPVFVKKRAGRPYMVEAMPATASMRDIFPQIAALLVITDLNARPQPPDGPIREAFRLNPTEARLATTLATGANLRTQPIYSQSPTRQLAGT